MNKTKSFIKKYGFYMAVCVVSVGAIAAVFFMSEKQGHITDEVNPYAKHEETAGRVVDDLEDNTHSFVLDPVTDQEDVTAQKANEKAVDKKADTSKEVVTTEVGEVNSETFSSTTATKEEPFFAEGDTFLWPTKEAKITVPYTDNSTEHWFSESLDQTIRTNGICINGAQGDKVKVGAEGTIIAVVEESTTLDDLLMPGNIGKVVKVDHGNGYITTYGLQKGTFAEGLEKGMHVKAGDTIGIVGGPTGPFISAGPNVYMQVTQNDELVNPQNLLAYVNSVAMGHDSDNK